MEQYVWMVVAIAVTVLVPLAGGLLLCLRYLAGQISSFECTLCPREAQCWLSGVASLQLDSLEWCRPTSFSIRSSRSWGRLNLELSEVRRRREQRRVVEVYCVDATRSPEDFDLAMMEESHLVLVVWVESVTPEQPRFL